MSHCPSTLSPLLETVRRSPTDRAPVLYVRHAERGPIDDPSSGVGVPLTAEGLAAAEAFGQQLSRWPHVVLYHSPVYRCRQTAQAMAVGIEQAGGQVVAVACRPLLGGPYLLQPAAALELARNMGETFLRAWFDDQLPPGFMKDRMAAAREQVDGCCAAARTPGAQLVVMVTHDWNVLLVREALLGLRHEEHGWIDFLDGLVIRACQDFIWCGFRQWQSETPATPEPNAP